MEDEAMVPKDERLTIPYGEIRGDDFGVVGIKNANLGDLTTAGVPVSPGFAITIGAMERFIDETGIGESLAHLVKINGEVSYETAKKVGDAARRLIESTPLPSRLGDAIVHEYRKLCGKSGNPDCPVAVRSSAAVPKPGQTESYLNVRGEKDLVDHVRKCWSSAYNVEAIMRGTDAPHPLSLAMGVGVLQMVNAGVSGVIFTINPLNGDPSKICIDASYGLGEAVASGMVTPDTYFLDKIVMELVKTIIGSKEIQYVYSDRGSDIVQVPVPEEKRNAPCLTRAEMLALARMGKLIEDHYGKACIIEFAIDAHLPLPESVRVLQVRPETVWSDKKAAARTEKKKDALDRLVGLLIAGVKLEKEPEKNVHRPSLLKDGEAGCCPLCTLLSLGRQTGED